MNGQNLHIVAAIEKKKLCLKLEECRFENIRSSVDSNFHELRPNFQRWKNLCFD